MRECAQHPIYGQIVYDEGLWSGKKAVIKGNLYAGVTLCIENENIVVAPKPKWYEMLLAVLPLLFLTIWGNSKALCSIFPVVGGALGGALGGMGLCVSLLFMKRSRSFAEKMMIGFSALVATVLVAFALAAVLLQIM